MIGNVDLTKTEKNSDLPLINNQKPVKLLNLRLSNTKALQNKENEKNQLKFNIQNKGLNKSMH